jgi:hypothetical protein
MYTSASGINFVGIEAEVTGKASEAKENHYLLWYGQFSTTGTAKPVEEESETRLLQGTIENESFAIVQQITTVSGETPEYQVFPYFFEGSSTLIGKTTAFRILNKE